MTKDFTALSLSEVVAEFSTMAAETTSVFGLLDERQLNWRPAATSWSVAQCFDHLLTANREMFQAIDTALDGSHPRRCGSGSHPAARPRVNTDQVAGA